MYIVWWKDITSCCPNFFAPLEFLDQVVPRPRPTWTSWCLSMSKNCALSSLCDSYVYPRFYIPIVIVNILKVSLFLQWDRPPIMVNQYRMHRLYIIRIIYIESLRWCCEKSQCVWGSKIWSTASSKRGDWSEKLRIWEILRCFQVPFPSHVRRGFNWRKEKRSLWPTSWKEDGAVCWWLVTLACFTPETELCSHIDWIRLHRMPWDLAWFGSTLQFPTHLNERYFLCEGQHRLSATTQVLSAFAS